MTISGAELKTTLGGLGLPPSWFAEKMGVTMRTVVRWFDLDAVSLDVQGAVDELYYEAENAVTDIINATKPRSKSAVLSTYRTDEDIHDGKPATWHRQLTFRAMEYMREQEGLEVSVRYV